MSTATPTNVTVKIDPATTSLQTDIIGPATRVTAGVMTSADKIKLDALLGSEVTSVTGTAPITSTGGENPDIGITPATVTDAGSMSAADKLKLDGLSPGGAALDFAEFFGLTAGTGMAGTDYAGTIAVRTANGTGAMPFPQIGPAKSGTGITALTSTTFNLAAIGVYEVSFKVHTTELGQFKAVLNNTLLPATCFANMNPTSGGHPIGGTVLVETTLVNSVLEIVNPNGNSTALTITPANGSQTHANAQTLSIVRLS